MSPGHNPVTSADWHWPPSGSDAVIATRHGKEAAIRPALAEFALNWIAPPPGFDSDRFGTFTRDIKRAGSQIEAARAKAQAVLDLCPTVRIALASEGAFGPDPMLPIVPRGAELILLRDRWSGIELVGHDVGWDTNFAQRSVRSTAEADAFAQAIGFPEHGLIVMTPDGTAPRVKDIPTIETLHQHVTDDIGRAGQCWLETDMRAHRNPRRMAAIGRAAQRLADAMRLHCPHCRRPGFVARTEAGRPCSWCKTATLEPWRSVSRCAGCGHEQSALIDPARHADPGACPECNP